VLITNARIVNEGKTVEGDVLIKDGRIDKIASSIAAPDNVPVHDAAGKWLLPGMIDDQVHFREPGLTHKGDIATESAAAVAGGITSFFDMPNTIPNCTVRSELAAKYERAQGRARANYAFYFGAANDNLAEILALQPGDCPGVKIFMGASTGNMLVDDPLILETIFSQSDQVLITHCEDTPTIKANEEEARQKYGEDVPFSEHPRIRSAEACWKSTQLAIGLAQRHNTRLHVLHLTTARELEFFKPGPLRDKRITVEVCVHHLYLDEGSYAEWGAKVKCNPAIKTAEDRAALVRAVAEDRIDIIATDHAPHTREEKGQSYFKAPSGLPLVQHALPMLLDLVQRGELDLHTVVNKTSHAIAERFGVRDRGYIREGCWADLVLIDREGKTTVTPESVLYKCGWSPLEGRSFPCVIDTTWVNGAYAWRDGKVADAVLGQRIEFVSR
jgi:dihydroorotase